MYTVTDVVEMGNAQELILDGAGKVAPQSDDIELESTFPLECFDE